MCLQGQKSKNFYLPEHFLVPTLVSSWFIFVHFVKKERTQSFIYVVWKFIYNWRNTFSFSSSMLISFSFSLLELPLLTPSPVQECASISWEQRVSVLWECGRGCVKCLIHWIIWKDMIILSIMNRLRIRTNICSISNSKHLWRPFGNLGIGISASASELTLASASAFQYKYSFLHSINSLRVKS